MAVWDFRFLFRLEMAARKDVDARDDEEVIYNARSNKGSGGGPLSNASNSFLDSTRCVRQVPQELVTQAASIFI